jgi:hypothetical protein
LCAAGDEQQPEHNWNRALWKRICWQLVADECFSLHERALYGLLAGHADSALAVATSWHDDALWVLYRCLEHQTLLTMTSARVSSRCFRATRLPLTPSRLLLLRQSVSSTTFCVEIITLISTWKKVYNVLLFPRGWMAMSEASDDSSERKRLELEAMQRRHLTRLTLQPADGQPSKTLEQGGVAD